MYSKLEELPLVTSVFELIGRFLHIQPRLSTTTGTIWFYAFCRIERSN